MLSFWIFFLALMALWGLEKLPQTSLSGFGLCSSNNEFSSASPLSWALVGLTLGEKSHLCLSFELFCLYWWLYGALKSLFGHNIHWKRNLKTNPTLTWLGHKG